VSERDDELHPDVLDLLALGLRASAPPRADVRAHLLARAGGPDRFLPFVDRLVDLFDLPEDAITGELRTIDDPDAWEELAPGVRFRDFEGGPRLGEAHGGLARVEPGEVFPMHSHVGEERLLVLQGRIEDEHGRSYRAGDMIVSPDGSAHELRAVGDKEVIYAAAVIALDFPEQPDD
jgi:quercetin dioxygenase-like cupin family protein